MRTRTVHLLQLAGRRLSLQRPLRGDMNVYVFPTEGQDSNTQSQHEAECYNWAVQNTGTDPFDLAKQVESATKL